MSSDDGGFAGASSPTLPQVPGVADGIEHKLDIKWIKLARRRRLAWLPVTNLFWAGALAAGAAFTDVPPEYVRVAWVLFGIKVVFNLSKGWFWPPVQYRHRSYKVDKHGIQIRGGVWNRVVRSVPRSRVQHIDVSHGFWERSLGLATLTIHTAGRENAAVDLEGVSHDNAVRIRDYLLPQDDGIGDAV